MLRSSIYRFAVSFLAALVLVLFALPAAATTTCTTPPLVTGSEGSYPPSPSTDYITSWYRWTSTEPYSLKVWSTLTRAKVTFGSGSGITVLNYDECLVPGAACSAFTGNKIASLYLPTATLGDGTKVVRVFANGSEVGEWYGVENFTGSLKNGTVGWSEGITQITQAAGAWSEIVFVGGDKDNNGVVHNKSIVAFLSNPCGSFFGP